MSEWLDGRVEMFVMLVVCFPIEAAILFTCGFVSHVAWRRWRDGV